MQNEVLSAINGRYSCKVFSSELPEAEKLQAIAEAAITSPSAMNKQPWQVIVTTDKGLLAEIEAETVEQMGKIPEFKQFYEAVKAGMVKVFHNAPCVIFLPIDASNDYAKFDCGIISQTVCLAAKGLDVASRIVAIPSLAFAGDRGAYFKKRLGFKGGYEYGLAVLIGKEEGQGAPKETDKSKISYIG